MTTTIPRTIRTRVMNDAVDGDALRAAVKNTNGSSNGATRAVNARVDETEIPGWVYRRFPSTDGEGTAPATSDRNGAARHIVARAVQAHILEPAISDLVHVALTRTGYPLHHVRCWNDEETLTLTGFVTRYFYAQIALEIALRLANGRRIEAHIDVQPAPDRDQWDDEAFACDH